MIPYGRQHIDKSDIDAVMEVLTSKFLTQGPKVPNFEDAISKKFGSEYAIAVNSATSALHIACMALGIGPGDWLWTSPITFVASANCGLYCGARVDFVDIDPGTFNISISALEAKLIEAKTSNRLPKVVVAVHLCGLSCDMKRLHELSKKYGFKIIEDASHAIGGKYDGKYIGNCKYSDITVFSFHPVKIITTAEGGVATTNDKCLYDKMNLFRSHGITREQEMMEYPNDDPWYYEQISLGYNYRMTELQAALGLNQLKSLDKFVNRRNEISMRYNQAFLQLPLKTQFIPFNSLSSMHLYVVRLQHAFGQINHRQIFKNLRSRGIGVNLHYIPVHTQPYYRKLGFNIGDFPNAEEYYADALSLPIFYDLTDNDQEYVIMSVKDELNHIEKDH